MTVLRLIQEEHEKVYYIFENVEISTVNSIMDNIKRDNEN